MKTNDCQNLRILWQKRTSSILTNNCVVLFNSLDCEINRSTQVFTQTNSRYFKRIFSRPDQVPNNNFYKSQ